MSKNAVSQSFERESVAGTAVDAAAAVDAVGVAEVAVPSVFGRVEAERAGLGAEAERQDNYKRQRLNPIFLFSSHDQLSFRSGYPR